MWWCELWVEFPRPLTSTWLEWSSVKHSPLHADAARVVPGRVPCRLSFGNLQTSILNVTFPDVFESNRCVFGVYLFSNVKPWLATVSFCLCWCVTSCKYRVFVFLFISIDHTLISHKCMVMCKYKYVYFTLCVKYIVQHSPFWHCSL